MNGLPDRTYLLAGRRASLSVSAPNLWRWDRGVKSDDAGAAQCGCAKRAFSCTVWLARLRVPLLFTLFLQVLLQSSSKYSNLAGAIHKLSVAVQQHDTIDAAAIEVRSSLMGLSGVRLLSRCQVSGVLQRYVGLAVDGSD
jgi:hypothetical protein